MKGSQIDDALGQVLRDLDTPVPPHTLTKEKLKMVKKVDKDEDKKGKKSKKVEAEAPKKGKKAAAEDDGDKVTLASLADEAEISPAAARRKVRALEIERGDGRWAWDKGSKALRTVREALGLK